MFGSDKKTLGIKKNGDLGSGSVNIIVSNTRIKGEINTSSDLRIDGTIEGNIDSGAKVVLGESGKIKGNIYCKDADIWGEVEGNIYCKGLIDLKEKSTVTGDIFTKRLMVENGAFFNGTSQMSDEIPVKGSTKEHGEQGKTGSAGNQEKTSSV